MSQTDEVIIGPSSPADWSSWIDNINKKRTEDLASINYNGSIFNVIDLQWGQSSFIQPQMHGYDAYFYDVNSHSYTYDKWLTDLKQRYGGIDALLFWVTYTNLGADDRNQFDLMACVPGSISGLRKMVDYMHSQDPPIYVFFPYNPWDTGTNPSGLPDYKMIAKFLNETNADGFNGDTMNGIPEEYYTYSVNEYNHPIAMQPENYWELSGMNYDTMGWGYWNWPYSYQPNVDRWKFYDGRHMTNLEDRWVHNHTDDIQNAFFNAIGIESWENVWGSWNGIVPRDAEAIRRTATILRYFGNRNNNPTAQNFTQSAEWLPYIPIISDRKYWNDLFASSFIVNKGNDKQQILFLIVNRNVVNISATTITFNNTFTINSDKLHIFDCYYGKELKFTISQDTINVNIDIEALGYGAILATMDTRTSNKDLDQFLSIMNNMTQKPLSSYSSKWKYLLQTMTPIASTQLYSSAPANMVTIPWGIFFFNNNGVEIEGDDSNGVDVQFQFEMSPKREHIQYMTMNKFYIDKHPVTNSEYKTYLDQSGYRPNDTYNFLKNWNYDQQTQTYNFPKGYDKKPVIYLGLNEARLYCKYNNKRLPHSYEWQYAAQGNTTFIYPWGNTQKMGRNFPEQQHGTTLPGPADVDAFVPQGNSMFGVSDLIGNVWQYTDEFTDDHTRAVVVMGSANYRPIALDNAPWYFPNAFQLNQHNKYFLMDNSYERCGTIGFRCAADAVQLSNGKPMFWEGKGVYCNDYNMTTNGVLCGKITAGNGYNNLTDIGKLDWVQFGFNSKDKSDYKMIRKQTNDVYIANISAGSTVSIYEDNSIGFYWNDGQSDMSLLSKDDASTYGVFIGSDSFSFVINNLVGGSVYKLRIFVGVFQEGGILDVNLNIDGKTSNVFQDNTVYYSKGTTDVCYEININLSSISKSQMIRLLIDWIVSGRNGNITLQAIAIEMLDNKTQK